MAESRTVATASRIPPGEMKVIDLDGQEVVIANVNGAFYAFSNTCTHEGGPLGEGELEGETVTCPWHFTKFNVKTGTVVEGVTDDPVPTYEVRLEGDEIKLRKR